MTLSGQDHSNFLIHLLIAFWCLKIYKPYKDQRDDGIEYIDIYKILFEENILIQRNHECSFIN